MNPLFNDMNFQYDEFPEQLKKGVDDPCIYFNISVVSVLK